MKKENNTQESIENPIDAALSKAVVEPIIASIEDHAQVTMDAFGLCYEKLDAIAKCVEGIAAKMKLPVESDD